jgi:23S rRNA (uracil1939-C5)-methyltransferase
MPDYQKDQILELTIHDLSEDGKGIARTHEGLVVFVNNCVPADKVKAKIIRVKKKFAKAELLEITDSSICRTCSMITSSN